MYEIFQFSNILNLQLQNDKMDIVSAYKLSQTTIAHLYKIKENDFDCIYKTSIEICNRKETFQIHRMIYITSISKNLITLWKFLL